MAADDAKRQHMALMRFSGFTLDSLNRVLLYRGSPVEVEPKVFECIELLVSRPGQLTTLKRLRKALWPDVHVSDSALRRVISKRESCSEIEGISSR